MALTLLRRRMYNSQKIPLPQGSWVNITNQRNNNPVRLYSQSGSLENESGDTFLDSAGYVNVWVQDNVPYTLTAYDAGGRIIARTFDIQPEDPYDDQTLMSAPPPVSVSSVFSSSDGTLIDENGNPLPMIGTLVGNQLTLGPTTVSSIKIGNDLILDVAGLLSSSSGDRVSVRTVGGKKTLVADSSAYTNKSGDYTILATDADLRFSCSTALVATVTSASKDTLWFPPASGNLTVRAGSGVTLNGSSADQVRSLSLNRGGVAILINPVVANDFTVTGF